MSHIADHLTHRFRLFTMLVGVVCLGAATRSIGAQTRFLRPDTTIDFSRYHYGEECYAAFRRVQARYENQQKIWRDTLVVSTRETQIPLADPIVEAMQPCAHQFPTDTTWQAREDLWLHTLLAVNRDTEAMAFMRRRIARVAGNDTAQWTLLVGGIGAYLQARPVRIAAADSLLQQMEGLATRLGLVEKTIAYEMHMQFAEYIADTGLMVSTARRALVFYESLPKTDRLSIGPGSRRPFLRQMHEILSMADIRDSLAKSEDAYVAIKRSVRKLWQDDGANATQAIGSVAPTIEGDFWYAQAADSRGGFRIGPATPIARAESKYRVDAQVRPTRGRVGLIVFFDDCRASAPPKRLLLVTWEGLEEHLLGGKRGECFDAFATLRRLAARFPDLEITIVSQTGGYVDGATGILTPEEEANTLANWWFGFHRLPGVLAVSDELYFRLEAPDNRRIGRPVRNAYHYDFGGKFIGTGHRGAYVVDPRGVILHAGRLGREGEGQFREILEVVMARHRGRVER